jgi:hypothetical protein
MLPQANCPASRKGSHPAVREYRVYFVDRTGRINRPAKIIQCADDQAAIEGAQQFIDRYDIEVWELGRLVAEFPRK